VASRGIWTIFAAVNRVIPRAGPRNLAKFSAENCGP